MIVSCYRWLGELLFSLSSFRFDCLCYCVGCCSFDKHCGEGHWVREDCVGFVVPVGDSSDGHGAKLWCVEAQDVVRTTKKEANT